MKSGIAWMDYIFHIPTVTPKELEGEDKTSMDLQGVSQTATPEFAIKEQIIIIMRKLKSHLILIICPSLSIQQLEM